MQVGVIMRKGFGAHVELKERKAKPS